MQANMRQLKANLSGYVKKASDGQCVTVNVHSRPVARIVPFKAAATLQGIAQLPGVRWNGAKPAGLVSGERMVGGVSLSDWIKQDRR
jgi:prevent-host-death family protein